MRWAQKVKQEIEQAGYTVTKRLSDGHWEIRDDLNIVYQGRSMGDILRKIGNDLEIPV